MGLASMVAALGIFCMSLPYFAGRGKELISGSFYMNTLISLSSYIFELSILFDMTYI